MCKGTIRGEGVNMVPRISWRFSFLWPVYKSNGKIKLQILSKICRLIREYIRYFHSNCLAALLSCRLPLWRKLLAIKSNVFWTWNFRKILDMKRVNFFAGCRREKIVEGEQIESARSGTRKIRWKSLGMEDRGN